MEISEIEQLWEVDCKIPLDDLGSASSNTPILHNKYYRIYTKEVLLLKQMNHEYNLQFKDRYRYYTNRGEDSDYRDEPLGDKILNKEVSIYMEADHKLVKLKWKLEQQEQKVIYLQDIIKQINNRHWSVRNSIEWLKFTKGES